ncbi:MAG: twin-arginine translocation signal domain-containing protein [Pyrinomonadaceae bacterium]
MSFSRRNFLQLSTIGGAIFLAACQNNEVTYAISRT